MTYRRGFHRKVVERLRLAHGRRETGRLRAVSGKSVREIHFRDGRIVGVRTSMEQERIGSLLAREGLVTRQQLEDAYVFVRHGRRLGETLVELGILEPAEIPAILRRQALEISCSIVNAERATFAFHETRDVFTTLRTPLLAADVIMEAARRVDDADTLLKSVRADSRRFRPAAETFLEELSGLTPGDVYLLSRFRDGATTDEILRSGGADPETLTRSIFGLIESGTLCPTESERHDSKSSAGSLEPFVREVDRMHRLLQKKDPWSALGLPRDVGIETARSAFRNALRRYHPDRYQKIKDPDFQRQLASLCSKFTDAFTCLTTSLQMQSRKEESAIALASTWTSSNAVTGSTRPERTKPSPASTPTKRAVSHGNRGAETGARQETASEHGPSAGGNAADEGPRSEPPVYDAAVYFREGKRALLRGDYWRAIQLIQRSLEMNCDQAEAHYLLGEALSKNPKWRHEAEKSFERAIALEPWTRKYYDGLVRLYREAGLHQRAARLLRRAEAVGLESTSAAPGPDGTFGNALVG